MINGIIVIKKESGFTSHDVVAKMRGICGQRKIGHTGTLDPAATGVLPVCLGNGTKLCDMLTDKDKEYVAELLLGVTTDTEDMTGQILTQNPVSCTKEEVEKVCQSFVGEYDQIPPMYSALKINGKKLYELAREGKIVERKSRSVCIHELEILSMELPVVKLRVVCSKGTYIRTLCSDIGGVLGCGGAMKSLMRTRVGRFESKDAITLGDLQKLKDEGRLEEAVLPTDTLFLDCPELSVREEALFLLENGNVLRPEHMTEERVYPEGQWVRIYGRNHTFTGVYTYNREKACYKCVKMFL